MFIKDILTIDLSEDIKNVIDLEDISEAAIQSEIENYIITDGLANEYEKFVSTFTSNIVETGVWISGFYGSGKSYFGKLLGYLISNRLINGTPARDRVLQRFTGIDDEALVKNTIAKLDSVNARVVFMDIAKQDTSKGFSYALFRNFLKSLDLPQNEHGFLLYSMMCDSGYGNAEYFVHDRIGASWNELKNKRLLYIGKIKEIYIATGNSESDYNNILTTIRREIDEFSASRLKEELTNYLKAEKDEKIVFLFDEASEAINQKKFTLLDLEGLSEALSSLGGKVWTIAIAQEKLDDVINNSNINKAQLTKVTDRFKIKIHLEATEVDVIIRSRLLKKKDNYIDKLREYYISNSGKIADHSGLIGTGKTEDINSYVTYYPFYQYHFGLLQNFLFGRQGYASTKVAARGMIITTYDILKKEVQNERLFSAATGWQIAKEAQPQPPVRLVNRYENADRILKQGHFSLPGRHLLETIHFLSEAEVAPASLGNIVKSYIKVPEDYHSVQPEISKALDTLVEHKILLLTNGTYRITSDIEQRLLDEMNQYPVQVFKKKQQVIAAFKNAAFVKTLARITDINLPYDFYITSDNDDELTNPALKQLKIRVKSLYNFSDDRNADIDQIRSQYQNDKDTIWLVPDNGSFKDIDKLLDEIERIKYLEEKYTNPKSDEGEHVRAFQAERSIKENRLKELVEQSLYQGNSIYLYNTAQLDKNNWQTTINGLQRQMIQNVYSKRLGSQLSDAIAERIIKEGNNQRLPTYFNNLGADFQFFDAHGNFTGESLKPAEEVLFKIRNTFVDGSTLEKDLEQPPNGYVFGTVISTVAALMRGGKIMAKHNGNEKFSWKDEGVSGIFSVAREFRKASFKAIARSLSAGQKNTIVTSLQEMECETHTSRKIDWNTNDFELVNAIRDLAQRFCDKVDDMKRTHKDFTTLFDTLELSKDVLGTFTGAVSEANYVDRAEDFIARKTEYASAFKEIDSAEKFIRNKLEKLRQWIVFAGGVADEITKTGRADKDLLQYVVNFNSLSAKDVVRNYPLLQKSVQQIKDAYFALMKSAAEEMSGKYLSIQKQADDLISEIGSLPAGLNSDAETKVKSIVQYANQRTSAAVEIDFEIKDKQTKFSYSEMLSSIELFDTRKAELELISAELVREKPEVKPPSDPENPVIKTYTARLPSKKMKVSSYKQWLHDELKKLAGANDNDDVSISNE
jgi:hypothetical protein